MKTIRTWLDIESAENIPDYLHHHVRAYRVFQQYNREYATCSGRLAYDTAVMLLVDVLKLDKRRAKDVVETGSGIFWDLDPRRSFEVVLVGYRRVCQKIGTLPAQGKGVDVPVADIAGNIAKFRGLIAAAKVQAMLYDKPHVETTRAELTRILGVSVPTLRKYVKQGWIVAIPQLEIVKADADKGKPLYDIPLKPGERTWWGVNGWRSVVRQTVNCYSTRFMQEAGILPERLEGMGRLRDARVAGMGERYRWARVPIDFVKGVFLPSKVSPNWAAMAWA